MEAAASAAAAAILADSVPVFDWLDDDAWLEYCVAVEAIRSRHALHKV